MAISDLSVTVTDGKTSVVPGVNYSFHLFGAPYNDYTVTVTNNGPDPVTQFTLDIASGAGLSLVLESHGSVGQLTPNSNGTRWVWGGGSLASGQSASPSFTYQIDPSATGPLTLTFTVSAPAGTTDPNPANDSSTDSDTVTPQADLAVTMTDGKSSAAPGDVNTYTITVTNNGPSPITSLTLADTIPAGLLNASFTPSVGTYDPNTGVWSGLNLASGQNVSMTLTGTIDPNATGTLSNTVIVSPPSGTTDANPINNSSTDTDTLTPQADLSVTMTDGVTTVAPGASITYTITVTNNGPSMVDALVTDLFPADFTNVLWFVVLNSGAISASPAGAFGDINNATAKLLPGGSATFVARGQISASATGSLVNTVTVATPAGTTDPTPGNNSVTDTDTFPTADLAVTLTDGKTSVVLGTSNTYTITVTNNGPDTVTSLGLTDTIPAALLNPNFAPSAGAYDPNTGLWSGLSLASGQSVTMTLTGTIDANATGSLSNTVTVAAPGGVTDSNPSNNAATDTDTLALPADLAVTITDAATTLVPGSVDTYTITVSNNGPNTVSSFTLTDAIPDALLNATFGTPSAGSYNAGSGLWSGLNLASGQSVSITRSAVIGIATGSLSNTVTVSLPAGLGDPNPGNNAATDTDTLVLFSSPYPPPPPATSAHMVLRRGDGLFAIYDIGSNANLAAHPLAQVGSDWQFAGLGSVQAGGGTAMFLRQQNGPGATGSFGIYNISNNNIVSAAMLGQLDGQALGFGNFGSRGENDVLLRNGTAFSVANVANDQIIGTVPLGGTGINWQLAGFGNFSSHPGEYDMLLRDTTSGGLQVYDIANNRITNSAFMGTVGLDWQVSGFSGFGTRPGETDMIMRNVNTGGLQVYDIANNAITNSAFLGTVGLEWQFAGVAPVRGAGTSDLVLRNVNTGAFEAYNIANNQVIGAASLGQVGLEWQVGGFAADSASGSLGLTAQLVQAMAGFGGGGAADGFNVAALGADASQQTFLTQPHA